MRAETKQPQERCEPGSHVVRPVAKPPLARWQKRHCFGVVVGHFWRAQYGRFSRVPKKQARLLGGSASAAALVCAFIVVSARRQIPELLHSGLTLTQLPRRFCPVHYY